MTTTITLPDNLVRQLQQRAMRQHRSVEALAIEYIEAALTETETDPGAINDDAELLALVARIKATPPNPASIIPASRSIDEVLQVMVQGDPDQELLDALDAAELELRAIDRLNDLAEGRG